MFNDYKRGQLVQAARSFHLVFAADGRVYQMAMDEFYRHVRNNLPGYFVDTTLDEGALQVLAVMIIAAAEGYIPSDPPSL